MTSLLDHIKRFAQLEPSGYDHPSLKESFNKLTQSPFGRQAKAFSQQQDYEIIINDKMQETILGSCDYYNIYVRTGATYDTLAHEMRHAFQIHALGTHVGTGGYNPLFRHMEVRMTEADAFTFSCLVKLSRWKELGYKQADICANDIDDTNNLDLGVYAAYANKNYDPKVLLEILRRVFDYYYKTIATASGVMDETYEKRGMEVAALSYQKLEEALTPPKTMMGVIRNTLFSSRHKTAVNEKITEYQDTKRLVDNLAERLGQIPGLEANYLTDTTGYKFSEPAYLGLAMPEVFKFHADWHQKIQAQINQHRQLTPPG